MGQVSFNEDLEDLRIERDHMLGGFDSLIAGLQKGRTLPEIRKVNAELETILEQVTRALEREKNAAKAAFDEAERLLKSPGVRISKLLQKRERQLAEARERINEFDKFRAGHEKLKDKAGNLLTENAALKAELD